MRWVTPCLVVVATGACAPEVEMAPEESLAGLFGGGVRLVDMTHALSGDMPFRPRRGGNPFQHDTLSAHLDGAPRMAAFYTPEHHGTHLDAPVHGVAPIKIQGGSNGPVRTFGVVP